MRLTGKGIWGEPRDAREAIAVLRRAVELGVTLIDTADSYGPEVSERLIAEALYPYPQGLVIATKAGFERPGPDQWKTNGRPEHLRAACDGSLRRLKRSEEHTSELQSQSNLVCRLLLEKKKKHTVQAPQVFDITPEALAIWSVLAVRRSDSPAVDAGHRLIWAAL